MSEERKDVRRSIAALAVLLLLVGLLALALLVRSSDGPLPPTGEHESFEQPTASVGRAAAFTIAGSVEDVVVGVWRPIPVTVTNPNREPIRVTTLTVEVAGGPGGCDAAENFETRPTGTPFTVPAAADAYPVPASSRPAIRLRDTGSNQDSCKGRSFELVLDGKARQL
jgi:hypothetical protein